MRQLIDLKRIINAGQCFVVVGAGASNEMGYPTWKELAARVAAEITDAGQASDPATYAKYMEARKYPEVFSLAAQDLGGLDALLKRVKAALVAKHPQGEVYRYLASWRFACYLTTNFDAELESHLSRMGTGLPVLGNSESDFRKLRTGSMSGVVVKLHGSLDDPENVVLTSDQYADFRSSPRREYFRRKLGAIFDNHDVLIVGYSLADPDISFILEQARHYASPAHPIFAIAPDVTESEAAELYRTKNIRVTTYPNPDGTHRALVKHLLPTLSKFVAPRVASETVPPASEEEGDGAVASLYIYSQARLAAPRAGFIQVALEALVLRGLYKAHGGVARDRLLRVLLLSDTQGDLSADVDQAVASLKRRRAVIEVADDVLSLTDAGSREIEDNESDAQLLRQKVETQTQVDCRREFPDASDAHVNAFTRATIHGLDEAMKRRGLAIAACVFGGSEHDVRRDPDIFSTLHDSAAGLEEFTHRAFCIQYLTDAITSPTALMRDYLAALSQGHFAFHALGLHSGAARLRVDWLSQTVWILDSSVILPLLALNCYNHPYASDLFKRIRDLKLTVFTTKTLFQEVALHANWAQKCATHYGTGSADFMMVALLRGEYKQNLFIDGFVRSAAERPMLTFEAYMKEALGVGSGSYDLDTAIEAALARHNVKTVRFSEWSGFDQLDWGEVPRWSDAIREDRETHGTFTRPAQCDAEAEVLILLLGEREGRFSALGNDGPKRAYFVTQSGVLRRVFPEGDCPVWSPEAFYRYLLLFPTDVAWDSDAIYEAIRSDLFLAGVPVIDELSYGKFFKPQVIEATLRFKDAMQHFRSSEGRYLEAYTQVFDSLPELERPFFSIQVAWDLADRERRRAESIEKKAPLTDKERGELQRLKADEAYRRDQAKHKRRSNEQRKKKGHPNKKRKKAKTKQKKRK